MSVFSFLKTWYIILSFFFILPQRSENLLGWGRASGENHRLGGPPKPSKLSNTKAFKHRSHAALKMHFQMLIINVVLIYHSFT